MGMREIHSEARVWRGPPPHRLVHETFLVAESEDYFTTYRRYTRCGSVVREGASWNAADVERSTAAIDCIACLGASK